jgi:hypothetical protein
MKTIWDRYHLFLQNVFQRLSEKLYVPCQTGSHEMGSQHMGDMASTYIEHTHLPVTTRSPFRGIQLSKR